MRKIIVMLIAVFSFTAAFASERTLFDGEVEHGGYGGPTLQWSQINDKDALFAGAQGGWIIDHTFSIGVAGYGLVNDVKILDTADNRRKSIEMGYGGLLLQFIGNSDEVLHFNLDVLLAGGRVMFKNEADIEGKSDNFYAVQPEINIVLNVSEFFRITAGGGYRFAYDVNLGELNNRKLSGATAKVGFNFGAF